MHSFGLTIRLSVLLLEGKREGGVLTTRNIIKFCRSCCVGIAGLCEAAFGRMLRTSCCIFVMVVELTLAGVFCTFRHLWLLLQLPRGGP